MDKANLISIEQPKFLRICVNWKVEAIYFLLYILKTWSCPKFSFFPNLFSNYYLNLSNYCDPELCQLLYFHPVICHSSFLKHLPPCTVKDPLNFSPLTPTVTGLPCPRDLMADLTPVFVSLSASSALSYFFWDFYNKTSQYFHHHVVN